MQTACGLIVMGRHTFLRGHPAYGYALSYQAGGWKNPSFPKHLGGQKLGAPKGEAVRVGYVYTREFEFARVMLDTEGTSQYLLPFCTMVPNNLGLRCMWLPALCTTHLESWVNLFLNKFIKFIKLTPFVVLV